MSGRLGRILIAVAVATAVTGAVNPSIAGAKASAKPTIKKFSVSQKSVTTSNGWVALSAKVANGSSCTFSPSGTESIPGLPETVPCTTGSVAVFADLPKDTTTKAVKYTFTLSVLGANGTKAKKAHVTVKGGDGGNPAPTSVVSNGSGYCALNAATEVDCWGPGFSNDVRDQEDVGYSATPVIIPDSTGVAILSGVTSLVSDQDGYCAIVTTATVTGGVDCWGSDVGSGGAAGTATVAMPNVGGTGTLSGVTSLTSSTGSYCVLLSSGAVDCWGGENAYGELGDGTWGPGSSTPVQVDGVGGTGFLSDVTSVTGGYFGYCAILTSTGLDCWGFDNQGELGDGINGGPDGCALGCSWYPIAVLGTNGTSALSGVSSVASNGSDGYAGSWCAVLTDTSVVCWGWLNNNDKFYASVDVNGQAGNTLSGVASIVGSPVDQNGAFCALLVSAGVTCWETGNYGELGNGIETYDEYPSDNGPGSVLGVGGAGDLSGVTDITDGDDSYCAVYSGTVACWGQNNSDLGNGSSTGPDTCSSPSIDDSQCADVPVSVLGSGDSPLSGVDSVVGGEDDNYCAVLASGGVECWGNNPEGELGNGTQTDSDIAVTVLPPV